MNKRRSRAAERKLHIFSGSVYPELAEEMAGHLDVELGDITLEKFANGEDLRALHGIRSWRGCLPRPVDFG